jgi:signal transduction histidine kinase
MRSKILSTGGLALALFILLVLAFLIQRDMDNAAGAARDVDRSYMVLHKLDRVFSDLKDVEAGQRGYVITGNEEYLQPLLRSDAEIERLFEDLRAGAGNDPQEQARLAEIRGLAAKKLAQIKETIDVRRTKGYRAAKQMVESGTGEELMDRIRAQVAAARSSEDMLLKDKSDARRIAVRRLRGAIAGGGTASFVLLLTAFIFLRNEIAARMAVEEELRKHRDGLEHLVVERTRDLAVTNSRLILENVKRKRAETELKKSLEDVARSNRELDLFASIASHDLRSPLRSIAGFLNVLARQYGATLDDRAREYIAFAVSGAERMNVLLHDLYVYSRIGIEAKQFSVVNLGAALNAAIDNLRQVIEENGAVITSDALPLVEADDTQLVQLFQNLVGNAIKFRKKDVAPVVRVSLAAEPGTGAWIVGVHDNGIGIAGHHCERIFRIFERLHRAEEYPGTGLGLALCKKIVDRHGGRIGVESRPGEGSSFYFTIPKITTAAGGNDPGCCSLRSCADGGTGGGREIGIT